MRKPVEIDSDDDGPVIARAGAIDVAKATGMVCTRVPHAAKPGRKVTMVWEVQATTAAIMELAGHLAGLGIERIVLKATGDYWRCWHYLLSAAGLECWLVNAREVKNVPGRPKTDKLDAVWLCKLPVQGSAGFPEYLAGGGDADRRFHLREMRVDDLAQFSPESALREMSSSSANAFPAMSSAVLVLPSSDESFSFRAFSFLFSARSRASSSSPALFAGFPAVAGSVPFSCWCRQCSIWEWYSRSRRISSPRCGLPSGSASYWARIRALYAAVNVRRFGRPGWLELT
jgi:Transposase